MWKERSLTLIDIMGIPLKKEKKEKKEKKDHGNKKKQKNIFFVWRKWFWEKLFRKLYFSEKPS